MFDVRGGFKNKLKCSYLCISVKKKLDIFTLC